MLSFEQMSTVAQILSFAEFEALPDYEGKEELLEGELIQLPPPRYGHMNLAHDVYELIRSVLPRHRVYLESGYQSGARNWLVPDVSVTWPEQPIVNDYLQGAPMIAVEIVSPSNTAEQIDRKIAVYLNGGAAEVWVIYPRTKTMMVHGVNGAQRISGTYVSPLLAGLTVDLRELLAAC